MKNEGEYSIYELPNAAEDMINAHFQILFNNGTSPTNPQKNTYNDPEARVIDEYDLINNKRLVYFSHFNAHFLLYHLYQVGSE